MTGNSRKAGAGAVAETGVSRGAGAIVGGGIVGDYRIVRKIGSGGMGEVYLAEDIRQKRPAALKFLSPEWSKDDRQRRRFQSEAALARRLDHPNIVKIFESGDEGGRLYYAMEYVEGRSLREVIDTESIDYGRALDYAEQICSGLVQAHEGSVIHRDLKPSNVLVQSTGSLKILDFGLARLSVDPHGTLSTGIIGTPNYMSPEQAEGHPVDHRTDIFSFGTMFFELLTGVNPFARGHIPATVHAIVHDTPAPLASYRPDLPVECQRLIDKALAKRPEHRYHSAPELLADLKRLRSAGVAVRGQSERREAATTANSLAVLLFVSRGGAEDEHLGHGITEELTGELGRFGSIQVAPLRRALKFSEGDCDPGEVAAQLGVRMVLGGSIERTEIGLRIGVNLYDAVAGKAVWEERWEDAQEKLPNVKKALVEAVARQFGVQSDVRTQAGAGRAACGDAEAYGWYLRGNYLFDKKKSKADVDQAMELFQKALEREPSLIGARAGMAKVLSLRGEYEAAAVQLREALDESRRKSLTAEQPQLLTLLGRLEALRSNYALAREHLWRAIDICRDLDAVADEIAARSGMLAAIRLQGTFDGADEQFERVMQLSQGTGNRELTIDALNHMGWINLDRGRERQGREMFGAALTIAREMEDLAREAVMLNSIAASYIGKTGEANVRTELEYYERARTLWQKLGDKRAAAGAVHNIGLVHFKLGKFAEALKNFELAAEAIRAVGERAYFALFTANIADCLSATGEYEKAAERAREARKVAEEVGHPAYQAHLDTCLGWAYLHSGELDRATEYLERAIMVSEEKGFAWQSVKGLCHWGELEYHRGNFDLAAEMFSRAIRRGEGSGYDQYTIRAEGYQAAIDVVSGRYHDGIVRLSLMAERTDSPLLDIARRRLLGEAMAKHSRDAADREGGIQILQSALREAERVGFRLEHDLIARELERVGAGGRTSGREEE